MIKPIPPAFLFILGALIIPFLRFRKLKQFFQLFIPIIAFVNLLYMPEGTYWFYNFIGYELILGRVDKLSMCFGYVFVIIAFLGMVYALHVKEDGQHTAAFLYIGGTLGVTFAGDFFTLFIFWEVMAASSVFLIWYQKDEVSIAAGFRYILIHLFGGTLLLAGIIIYVANTGSIHFNSLEYGNFASQLILLGFIINAAVPPFHIWLPDSYPRATVTGSVFLSAFTTKSAVYVLLRGFPGVELLVWLGAIMAVYGVIYAIIENNTRKLLSYHIISQVGYMVCGVGLGTEMAINGSTALAFTNILYKSLLFMGVGAVIHVTGYGKISDLKGRNLYQKMPICLLLYVIGGFSISAVPPFNGFISKSMVVAAAGELHRPLIHLLLHLTSIGTFLSVALKLPYGTWFGKASKKEKHEIQAKEAPLNMLIAMGMIAFLCIFTGIYPNALYNLLPHPVHYHPYTLYHVVSMMQLVLLTAAVFWLLIDKLAVKAVINIDLDWFYWKAGKFFIWFCTYPLNELRFGIKSIFTSRVDSIARLSKNPFTAPMVLLWNLYLYSTKLVTPLIGSRSAELKRKKYEERLTSLKAKTYNEDIYRTPIGWGAILVLIFFLFLLVLISFLLWIII